MRSRSVMVPLLTVSVSLALLSLTSCSGDTPVAANHLPGPAGAAETAAIPDACEVVPDELRKRLVGLEATARPASEDLPENSVRSCVWTWAGPSGVKTGPATRLLAIDLTLHRSRQTLGSGAERAHERVDKHVGHEQAFRPRAVPGIGDEAFIWPEGQPHKVLLVFRKHNIVGEIEFTGTDWEAARNIPMSGAAAEEAATKVAGVIADAL